MNFEDIPKELIQKYKIIENNDEITVNKPSYINVDDPDYEIDEYVLTIRNDAVNVSLWINTYIMHITVY